MKGLTKVGDVAAANSELRQIIERVQKLKQLEYQLFLKLGSPLAQNFNVAAIHDDGALVLIARSAVWATRLRYLAPEILGWSKTASELKAVKSIQVQVGRNQLDP